MLLDNLAKVPKPFNNPFQLGGLPPMFLGWKVDNPARSGEGPILRHEHLADLDFLVFAGILIGAEVLRKRLFKHQSDPFAHHAYRIHGIHQRFGRGVEKITLGKFHHQKYQFLCTLDCTSRVRFASSAFTYASTAALQLQIPRSASSGTCFQLKASAWYRSFLPGSSGSCWKSLRFNKPQSISPRLSRSV